MPEFSIRVSDEVQSALDEGRPVVALESTIFTHGLPRPRNIDVARQGIQVAAEHGAVAATIGVVHGRPVVGLSDEEIVELSMDDAVQKISVRDLAPAAVSGTNGGTTIAATTFLARKAGIDVFSTGGLGGVHRGASTSFDESADLVTLSRIPIVLVSSGAKAILDVAATLERFETLSVPVIGYRTKEYPGFYVTRSGYTLSQQADSPAEIAQIFRAQQEYGVGSSVLVGNAVREEDQLDPAELEKVLAQALQAADDQAVHGQDATPFLLDYIQLHTQGRSLDANVALYLSNVELGAKIAGELVQKV